MKAILEKDGIIGSKQVISDFKVVRNKWGHGNRNVPSLECHITRNAECQKILRDK